jgi:hypothetical protein
VKEIQVVGSHQVMTGEDMKIWLLRHGLEEPTDHNAWGALVKHLSEAKLIKDTGQTSLGTTKQSHGRRLPIWRFD